MDREVDVVILTKDSEAVLSECLRSVYENVPVKSLIVVDGFSKDNTLKILERYNRCYRNIRVVSEHGSRGKARQRGLQEVSTEWFMFADSDVILCEDWFEKAGRYVRKDVGAIWGVDIPEGAEAWFLRKILQWMEARVFDIRGGCHDILIRHDCVRDIRIPQKLHTLEDAYIKQWITAKNYKVITSYSSYCIHCETMNSLMSRENTVSTIKELKNMRLVRERLIFAGVFFFMWLLNEARVRGRKRRRA